MPISLDKDRPTMRLVLKSDQGKAEAEQPHFIYRYLTAREWHQVAYKDDEIADKRESLSGAEAQKLLLEALQVGLIAIGGLPEIENDVTRLNEVLGMFEVRELIGQVLLTSTVGPEAKNALGSPSPGSSDESASPAPETVTEPAATKDG